MGQDLDACRVIFGEADGFPGLTVDRFHDLLVAQTLSVGMEQRKGLIFPLLAEILGHPRAGGPGAGQGLVPAAGEGDPGQPGDGDLRERHYI